MLTAVIGGGIGGASVAYFLRSVFKSSASIDLYEPHAIGGRVATINIAGRDYESGGSIIHPDNRYMVNFCKEFGLKKRAKDTSLFGFYDGEKFVYTESSWTIITLFRMLWRYGMDCFSIFYNVHSMLTSFSRIYKLQDDGETYSTPSELLHAMGGDEFVEWAHKPIQVVLKQWGFSDCFINEVVSVASRVNYGQSTNMTAFAGMVSIAGIMPGLWAVHGGNKKIPEELLKSSGAVWHHAKVSSVKNTTNGNETKFEVTATALQSNLVTTAEYDIVIVATPLTPGVESNIDFKGFTTPGFGSFGGQYQRTVATFINGQPNKETFGKKPDEYLPDVLTTRNISLDIRSLSRNFAVDITQEDQKIRKSDDGVYKVFSSGMLNDDQMKALFVSYKSKQAVDWLAYPHYTVDDDLPTFILSEGLYYINGIEWAASAMEMSVIGARNVALLARKHWQHVRSSSLMTHQKEKK